MDEQRIRELEQRIALARQDMEDAFSIYQMICLEHGVPELTRACEAARRALARAAAQYTSAQESLLAEMDLL